jgi:hypothetical protein
MRIPSLLLGLSLAVNCGLAFAWLSRPASLPGDSSITRSSPAVVVVPSGGVAEAGAVAPAAGDALSPELAKSLPDFLQRLMKGDFSTEIARLRASGMPDETVNMIAQVVIMQKFRKAYEEMSEDGMGLNMWGGNHARTDAQRERQRKMLEMQRELSEEARAAGVDSSWFSGLGSKVPGLSSEKAKLLARIEQDRQELVSQVHMESSGMMLDRDTERLKYIDAEFKKDLATVLSPEELEAWNLHRSETAQSLRAQLGYMAPTDEEFKKILRLQEAFNEAWPTSFGHQTDWQKRNEAEQAMKKQIADVLGPERSKDYEKATDYEFGTLSNLEYRLELPKGSADRVYGLHKETEAAARKIRADKSLSDADRKESLKVLAEQAKSEVVSVLGEEGFKAYKNQHSHWLDSLAR